MGRTKDYKNELLRSLREPGEAIEYLNAALEEENIDVFLLALRNVIDAYGGMTKVAALAVRNRESLYKTLSEKGNPYLVSIRSILKTLGYRFSVESIDNLESEGVDSKPEIAAVSSGVLESEENFDDTL